MLDGLLRQKLFDFLIFSEKLEGWLHDAVEDKGEVDQQRESNNLEPFKRFPSQSK